MDAGRMAVKVAYEYLCWKKASSLETASVRSPPLWSTLKAT